MTLLLNALAASSVRLLMNYGGPWVADVEYDLGAANVEATGPAVLTIDKEILAGRIDPKSSGAMGPKGRARLVGGLGWGTSVSAKDYSNPAGVLSTGVIATTAAEVGERVVDTLPTSYGMNYVRAEGSASSVLAGREWYVDATGTTIVGPRIPVPALPTVQVLDWDPSAQLATLAADAIVVPGTILTDTRFGIVVVRDTEQTWSDSGSRCRAWCMPSGTMPTNGGSRIAAGLRALARDAVAAPFVVGYAYRVGIQTPDGRVTLQALRPTKGIPNQATVQIAFGVPGVSSKLTPGTIVYVNFLEGDPSRPYVSAFESGAGLELTFDALSIVLGDTPRAPVMLMTPSMATWIAAVTVALNALAPGSAIAPVDAASLKVKAT